MLAVRLLIFFGALAVILAAASLSSGQSLFGEQRAASSCREPCDLHQIVWTGDILLADAMQPYLDRNGYAWPFQHLRPLLEADYVIGNAEGPITTRSEKYFSFTPWDYNAQPPAARALADAGFNALSLSNNHVLDRGPEGLEESLRHLRAAGIRPFGAGMNDEEAAAPLLVETRFGNVGVIGIGERWRAGAVAGPGQPGTVPITTETLARQHQQAKNAGARWVVAYVHWGANYSDVESDQRRFAQMFAKAGYDLVIGNHPHVAQPVEIVGGVPVLYSLGNFTFGTTGRYTAKIPGYSLVARTFLGPEGFQAIELTCIQTDNDVVKFQARPCTEEQARTLMKRLGSQVTLKGNRGWIELKRPLGS